MAVLSSVILFLASVCMCIQSYLSPWLNSRGPVKKFCAGNELRLQYVGNGTSCAPDSTQHELCDWTHYYKIFAVLSVYMNTALVYQPVHVIKSPFLFFLKTWTCILHELWKSIGHSALRYLKGLIWGFLDFSNFLRGSSVICSLLDWCAICFNQPVWTFFVPFHLKGLVDY